jgi:hypothetical protein
MATIGCQIVDGYDGTQRQAKTNSVSQAFYLRYAGALLAGVLLALRRYTKKGEQIALLYF